MNHSNCINNLYICPTYNHFDNCLPNANSLKKNISHTLSHAYTHTTTLIFCFSVSRARARFLFAALSLVFNYFYTQTRYLSGYSSRNNSFNSVNRFARSNHLCNRGRVQILSAQGYTFKRKCKHRCTYRCKYKFNIVALLLILLLLWGGYD